MKKLALLAILLAFVGGISFANGNAEEATNDKAVAKWPKNVEIIVPAGAGGDTDFNARLLAQKLTDKLGVNFVVSNVNGNGGATGTRQVKNAKNDGSTMLFYHSAVVVNQLTGASDYGFEAFDFACIAAQSRGNCITINSKLGVNNLPDLISYSKQHPGKLKIAVQTGATSHASALLLKSVGLDATIVDAGSAAGRLTALLGNHVDIILAAYGTIKDYIDAGELVAVGLDGLYDLDEVGVKSVESYGFNIGFPFYYSCSFPKGTPSVLVQQLSDSVKDIVENDEDYQARIFKAYYQKPVYFNSVDGLAEYQKVHDLLKDVSFGI
ncbi:MAG: tripartite tricarboxylate transporter substrate binding protein [Sphaerochaeta sp.]|nr:tripartite tricarboxylate transporter substrate binding protein [Sphaerochaeta sp.]